MSKMKHLLRKLHIGGGSGGGALTDHHPHHHHHRTVTDNPERTAATTTPHPLQQQPSTSAVSSQTTASATPVLESLENSNSSISSNGNATANAADFSLLEEEFQVQLALAISVSDPDSREDPETTAQITAAKQISLGCSPSQSLVDFLSLRYWSYNVVNYDEKVVDGFYDVYGTNSSLATQGKMPMLVDLESVQVTEKVDYEVILVNRMADMELRKLEEKVHLMSTECRALRTGPMMSFLVQKIADIVVDTMGGPVNDADEFMRKWEARSYELRISLNTIILPLGCLDIGLSRHRALLFKVLADRISLPCMLVKGSYYTGTDDGAVNLIKFGNGSEYIIDLMGAPGTLIPSEVPSSQLQDIRSVAPVMDTVFNPCSEFGGRTGTVLPVPSINEVAKTCTSAPEPSFAGTKSEGVCQTASENTQRELFERDFGNILPSLVRKPEESSGAVHIASTAQQIQVEDVSKYVVNAAKDPDFAQKLHAILLENSALQLADSSSSPDPHNVGELKVLQKNQLLKGERMVDAPLMCLSHNQQAVIPFPGMQLFGNVPHSRDTKIAAQRLVVQKQELASAVSNPGDKSSSGANDDGFVLVSGRTDYRLHADDVSKRIKVAGSCGQPNPYNTQDEQIDPLLGGVAEWEIPWEDLQIGERIGIGSYGEVYRAEWNGTEVAVKKFMNQDISGDALVQFKCEVEIMLRLRHPNLVLFMGAVTRPPNLSILTEFLPRGSLFKLLHRSNVQIDEKRRLRMALDVAKGMNYLHTSHPVIVHRDLKTPNLLVDKNWVVKVCDFGMSRLKHHTFLSSKSTAGTAEWMAPEVLRNEPCNEKSDVYSFGVILWELATLEVPWTGMNSMQVVGAVGFQGRRLNIPDRVDPVVAEIITDCWDSNPDKRPSFGEMITRLKCLQRLVVQKTDTKRDQLQS